MKEEKFDIDQAKLDYDPEFQTDVPIDYFNKELMGIVQNMNPKQILELPGVYDYLADLHRLGIEYDYAEMKFQDEKERENESDND